MATKEPIWTRAYLKSIGAQDNQIDYQNGAVTYKGKPFQYTTPAADGNAYGTQPELDSLYKSYQNNDAMDQLKASSANRMGEVNSTLGQYKQNISKPVTPFTYDMNSIKADPLYTSGLQSLQNDAQTATNQSLVNLGRRGIGNSQSAVTSANAQQQNVVNQANTKLAPQVIAQKYLQWQDANAQQDKQNQGLLGYANAVGGLGQQDFNNSRQLGSDQRLATQDQLSNDRLAKQDARQTQQDHNDLADKLSKEYGVRVDPKNDPALAYEQVTGLKTVAQQTQEAVAKKATIDNALKQFETIGVATPEIAKILGIPEGTTTQQAKYQQGQLGVQQQNATANTARANKPSAVKPDKPPSTSELQSSYVSGFDSLTPEQRNEAFTKERDNIINDLGISGYNSLRKMYYDKDGNPL
jgi:hypothetical protein